MTVIGTIESDEDFTEVLWRDYTKPPRFKEGEDKEWFRQSQQWKDYLEEQLTHHRLIREALEKSSIPDYRETRDETDLDLIKWGIWYFNEYKDSSPAWPPWHVFYHVLESVVSDARADERARIAEGLSKDAEKSLGPSAFELIKEHIEANHNCDRG
jgi:hypothetical protein